MVMRISFYQSLGWGSAGSPGKRNALYGAQCGWDMDTLRDVLDIIRVITIIQSMEPPFFSYLVSTNK